MKAGGQKTKTIKNTCIANHKTIIVVCAILSGVIGWVITFAAIRGRVMSDFKEMDAMTPTAESTFDIVFIRVIIAGFGMFAISFLGCIGAFNSNKCILFAFAIASLIEGIVLMAAAVATNSLLSASVPPIVMQTNRICRNIDSASMQLGCAARRLEAAPEEWSLYDQAVATHAALEWVKDRPRPRRMDAGTTEVQLLLRIASAQNQDRCVVLADICKLPSGVESMERSCTCNGKGVIDMVHNTQGDMDWVCPQPVATQAAPPECGSFCADWDGSGDLSRSWCFVNAPARSTTNEQGVVSGFRDNECVTHNFINATYGPMEPSTEACQAETLLRYPWSGLVSRGIFVAKTGVVLMSILSALMFASSLAAVALMWYVAGGQFGENMRTLTCDGKGGQESDGDQSDVMSQRGTLSEWTEGGSFTAGDSFRGTPAYEDGSPRPNWRT